MGLDHLRCTATPLSNDTHALLIYGLRLTRHTVYSACQLPTVGAAVPAIHAARGTRRIGPNDGHRVSIVDSPPRRLDIQGSPTLSAPEATFGSVSCACVLV